MAAVKVSIPIQLDVGPELLRADASVELASRLAEVVATNLAFMAGQLAADGHRGRAVVDEPVLHWTGPGLGALSARDRARTDARLRDAIRAACQRFAAASGPGGTASTAAPAAPAAPAPPPVTRSPADAYHAPTSAHDPNAPLVRNATWLMIQAAAISRLARVGLDIAWIDDLPGNLRDDIDERFADSIADRTVKATLKADRVRMESALARQVKDLEAATARRLSAADRSFQNKKAKDRQAAIDADPEHHAAKQKLEAEFQDRLEARETQLRSIADGPMTWDPQVDTVVKPPGPTVMRREGQMLLRVEFMSWAIDLLTSSDAVKQHVRGLQEVKPARGRADATGMFLSAAAVVRFEAARAEFEAAHPGYTIPVTSVALGLRKLHHDRKGIGMLGHALGIAFDVFAYDNPNQKIGNQHEHYGYLLDRFGGVDDKDGRSVMILGDDADAVIAQLGRDTAAGRTTAAGQAMVTRIQQQFHEMVATSDRFKASMQPHLQQLTEARDTYFNKPETERQLAQAIKDEKNADPVADQRLKAEKFTGDDAAKAARRDEIKLELTRRRDDLKDAVDKATEEVNTALAEAFADWLVVIDAELRDAESRQQAHDQRAAAQAQASQDLGAIDVRAPDARDRLDAFASDHGLARSSPSVSAAMYKKNLQVALAATQRPLDRRDRNSPVYIHNQIAVLESWKQRLKDPARVFGQGKVVSATPTARHWDTVVKVSDAAVMQMIEHGFIRDDAMPALPPANAAHPREVFNAEVVATLARHGFSPGATYRDTMHFDFIEGSSAVPGGRAWPNMQQDKYGPSGDLPTPLAPPARPPAPAPAQPPSRKI